MQGMSPIESAIADERFADRTVRRGSFGSRLRSFRLSRGLSQADVAAHLGVSKPSVCGWEKGRSRPRFARLAALADLLSIPQAELQEEPKESGAGALIDHSRMQIARMIGTSPGKVHIFIEI